MHEEQITVPRDLALRLSNWHASMYDPVYAVSSSGLAGRAVPRELFATATAKMSSYAEDSGFGKDQQCAHEVSSHMKAILGKGHTRLHVITAMARYLWSCAWCDEVEERGDSNILSGAEITHIASETPLDARGVASRLLNGFEEMNSINVEFAIEEEKPPNAYEYGGRLAGACVGHDAGEIGDYKTPHSENMTLRLLAQDLDKNYE